MFILSVKVTLHFFFPQLIDLKVTIDGLEKERDFYFGKLRDIEVLCQEADDNPILRKILDILYATEVSEFVEIVLAFTQLTNNLSRVHILNL